MRQAGTTLDDFKYMIPRNREEYNLKHNIVDAPPEPAPGPKAQAAAAATTDLGAQRWQLPHPPGNTPLPSMSSNISFSSFTIPNTCYSTAYITNKETNV